MSDLCYLLNDFLNRFVCTLYHKNNTSTCNNLYFHVFVIVCSWYLGILTIFVGAPPRRTARVRPPSRPSPSPPTTSGPHSLHASYPSRSTNALHRGMNMLSPLSPTSMLLAVFFIAVTVTTAQQQRNQQPLQPIGDVLHLVLDKDKNQKVTIIEVNSQLSMLESLFQNASPEDDEQGGEYKLLLQGVKASAPTIFTLLDSNNDDGLTKVELQYVTKFEKSLSKGGGMRDLLRDVYEILDTNGDELLSVDELWEGSSNDEIITKVTDKVHTLFPVRKSSKELEEFVKRTISSIGGGSGRGSGTMDKESIARGIAWIDDDNDGYVSRKEVGKAYNVAGKKFLEISKTSEYIVYIIYGELLIPLALYHHVVFIR